MKIDVPEEHAVVLLKVSDLMLRRQVIIGQGSFTIEVDDTEALVLAAALLAPDHRQHKTGPVQPGKRRGK